MAQTTTIKRHRKLPLRLNRTHPFCGLLRSVVGFGTKYTAHFEFNNSANWNKNFVYARLTPLPPLLNISEGISCLLCIQWANRTQLQRRLHYSWCSHGMEQFHVRRSFHRLCDHSSCGFQYGTVLVFITRNVWKTGRYYSCGSAFWWGEANGFGQGDIFTTHFKKCTRWD